MNQIEKAVNCFREEGFSCSQAVFSTYSGRFGLDRETSLRLSQPFGGGMAHLGETCGAVTGAFLLIGLKYGRTRAEDIEARERTYGLMHTFILKFKSIHGSIQCKCLLGLDISTPAGINQAQEKNLFKTLCPNFVRTSAEIIEEIL
ncbi:MAG: C-GCAxxG-C-C family protein [Candidatus Aminicenantales bacterium]